VFDSRELFSVVQVKSW